MEKSNTVMNGGMKLPIGYRFHPTDEELLVHYLRRKISGVPLPASVIPELDVFQSDPWSLPGDLKEKRYFFGRKWGNGGEKIRKISGGSGYWKPIGKGRPIVPSFLTNNHILGIRRTLIFCHGNRHSHHSKTRWIMHEYHLTASPAIPRKAQVAEMKLGDWVVHRIFQRRRRPKKQQIINSKSSITSFVEFTVEESFDGSGAPQPSSPCSSGITDVSFSGLDQEEISSRF